MAAANYNRPKPVDQIAWRRYCILRVRCACGRSVEGSVAAFESAFNLPPTMRLYELIDRLRCSTCGARPVHADVVWPGSRR